MTPGAVLTMIVGGLICGRALWHAETPAEFVVCAVIGAGVVWWGGWA